MNRLGLIPCLGALLALPACILTHGLGETAEGTGASDASNEDAEGSGTSSGEDPGSGGEPEPDPSATSGQTSSATATGDEGTGDEGTGDEGPDDPETDGEPEGCEHDPDYARWHFDTDFSSPVEGIEASYVAILGGDCTVDEVIEAAREGDAVVWSVVMQCSLQGRIDGDTEFVGVLSPVIEIDTSLGEEIVAAIGTEIRLALVLDWWGMGWNGWLVLEDPVTGEQRLDLVHAEHVDPYGSLWSRQVGEVLPGPWRETLSVGPVESECGAVGECNEQPRALMVGIGAGAPETVLEEWQEGTLGNDGLGLAYRASVTAARDIARPTCTDTPLGHYALAAWRLPSP